MVRSRHVGSVGPGGGCVRRIWVVEVSISQETERQQASERDLPWHCNAERCLCAEFRNVPQVIKERGRGREAAIPKIRERARGKREKR